jgi:hypothetical protein
MNSRRPTPNRVRFLGHDAFLIRGVVGWPFLLEGGRAILEELLLPAVEDRGLQAEFVTELREIGSFSSRYRLRMATFSSGE